MAESDDRNGNGGSDTRPLWIAIALLAVAVVVVAFLALSDDDEDDDAAPAASTTTSEATTTTESPASTTSETTQTTTTVVVDRSTAVWPSDDAAERYDDPVDAAEAFAVEFLGFVDPVVGEFMEGDSRSGEVEVRPREDGPATTVMLRQLSGEDTWSVLGAAVENIEVTEPAAGDAITSPVSLAGEALAFEGTVNVEIRQDGSDEPIGEGFVTGGGSEMSPFTGDVEFDEPTAEYGAIVFIVRSAEDGSVWQAAAMRVRFG